jgi:TonB family protein
MYFDFDDRYSDIEPVGSAINRRDGVAVSVVFHGALLLALLFLPQLLPKSAQQVPQQIPPQNEDRPVFVNVNPKLDIPALQPPKRAEASDIDRTARAELKSPVPSNPLPAASGNSAERNEETLEEKMKGKGEAPQPAPEAPKPVETPPLAPPQNDPQLAMMQRRAQQPQGGGQLGEALKNLQKYVQNESFNNQKGNVQEFGPLQFDTKGVEFGPWIRRFVSQVRRNWFVPYAAMSMRGRVVITFNVHRNGALTDVTVIRPSEIDSFNTAAVNALLASNPTTPLPPEYPEEKAFFTVTFYYNENPAGQ